MAEDARSIFIATVTEAIRRYESTTKECIRVALITDEINIEGSSSFLEIYPEKDRTSRYRVVIDIHGFTSLQASFLQIPNAVVFYTKEDEEKYSSLNGDYDSLPAVMKAVEVFPELKVDLESNKIYGSITGDWKEDPMMTRVGYVYRM